MAPRSLCVANLISAPGYVCVQYSEANEFHCSSICHCDSLVLIRGVLCVCVCSSEETGDHQGDRAAHRSHQQRWLWELHVSGKGLILFFSVMDPPPPTVVVFSNFCSWLTCNCTKKFFLTLKLPYFLLLCLSQSAWGHIPLMEAKSDLMVLKSGQIYISIRSQGDTQWRGTPLCSWENLLTSCIPLRKAQEYSTQWKRETS